MAVATTTSSDSLPAIYRVRIVLYFAVGIWSILLIVFTVLRLLYTLGPRSKRTEFHGNPFYEPEIAELLLSASLTLIFTMIMLWVLLSRKERGTFSRNWFEILGLTLNVLLWLGGAAATCNQFPQLPLCIRFEQCRVLQAVIAFAWLGFVFITILLLPVLWTVIKNKSWDGHSFQQWTIRRRMSPRKIESGSFYKETAAYGLEASPWNDRWRGSGTVLSGAYDFRRPESSFRLSSVSGSGIVRWFGWSPAGSQHRASSQPSHRRF